MQTLLYGAQIITQNEQDEIHKEGWILLEDDRIIGIGVDYGQQNATTCPASSISTPM